MSKELLLIVPLLLVTSSCDDGGNDGGPDGAPPIEDAGIDGDAASGDGDALPPDCAPHRAIAVESFDSSMGHLSVVSGGWQLAEGKLELARPLPIPETGASLGNGALFAGWLYGDFDLRVTAHVPEASDWDDFAVVFAYTDGSNFHYVSFNEQEGDTVNGVVAVSGGVEREIADIDIPLAEDTDLAVALEVRGNRFTVRVDGNEVSRGSAEAALVGQVGLGSINNRVLFDDFELLVSPCDRQSPSAPEGLSGEPVDGGAALSWGPAVDDVAVTSYTVRRDGAVITEIDFFGHRFADDTAEAGETYTYTVSARDPEGNESAESSPVTVSIEEPVLLPTHRDILLPRQLPVLVGSGSDIHAVDVYFNVAFVVGAFADATSSSEATFGVHLPGSWHLEPGSGESPEHDIATGSFPLVLRATDGSGAVQGEAGTQVILTDMSKTTPHRHLGIGDSMTRGGRHLERLLGKVPGILLRGTRHYDYDDEGLNREGQGGWTIRSFLTNSYSPFLFPEGVAGEDYWGSTEFWRQVVGAGGYSFDGYEKMARGWRPPGEPFLFDSSGYPRAPETGDVVYDETRSMDARFRRWTGSEWQAMSPQPAFELSVTKYFERYRSAFEEGGVFRAPDSVGIMLGTNTFLSSSETPSADRLDQWVGQMQELIDSIHAFDVSMPVIVQLPISCADFGGSQCRLNMQTVGRRVLAEWDNDAAQAAAIHVAGNLIALDIGTGFDSDEVHPNPYGYDQMGDCLGGVIQAIRH